MKNNKGSVLVAFVILIPIIILLIGYVIESSMISYNKVRLTSITKEMISYALDGYSKEDIENIYKKNNLNGDIEINYIDNKVNIKVKEKIDSYLNDLIDNDNYTIKLNITGYKENDKIIYEKG